jgi:hypothetical protein
VLSEHPCELRDQRDLANRSWRLWRNPPGGYSAVCPRELRAHMDHAAGEVDIAPDKSEQL